MTKMDISRGTTNVQLPVDVMQEIWAKTLEESAIMSLARHIAIPGPGVKVQTITGEPQADWVEETNPKPVGFHTFGAKTITPYKLAVIEPFSNEFRRDASALYAECINRLPYALASKFDYTVFHSTAPGSGFDVLSGCSKVSLIPGQNETVYDKFLAADAAIAAADGIMNGIALAPQGKSIVLGAVDGVGHPLFTPGVGSNTVGNILGAPVYVRKSAYKAGSAAVGTSGQSGYVAAVPAVVGCAGDWTDAVVGTVEGVQLSVSDQATLSYTDSNSQTVTLNLWQRNMFAVRVEIEVGFAVKSASEFVLLTGATPSA